MAGKATVFDYETIGDILIVTPKRDVTSFRDHELRDAYNEAYRQLMSGSLRNIIFDLSHLDHFGSTFVGMMLRLAKRSGDNGGSTVLCHMSDNVRHILKQLMLLENPKTGFLWRQMPTRANAVEWIESTQESDEEPNV
ncbi:MAG: STAS domain-containing protein [Fuerstiella sp.]|nr:STAS domain-containing protein [Fuerstiella sp.]